MHSYLYLVLQALTKNFTGEIRHANTYKYVTDDHKDKNILVIGGGETASDLCNEVA
jgi:cation diffusion facilitator CzcD-associated flavoprotein CzcO